MVAITFKFIYCSRFATQERFMSSPSFSPVHTLSFVYSQLWVCFTNRTQKSQIVDEIAFSFEFVIWQIWSSTYSLNDKIESKLCTYSNQAWFQYIISKYRFRIWNT